jgi:hypothetical protein
MYNTLEKIFISLRKLYKVENNSVNFMFIYIIYYNVVIISLFVFLKL